MKSLTERATDSLVRMVASAVFMTPLLGLVKVATPLPLPWLGVFIPWLGAFHLLLCWAAAQIIARVLWDLAKLMPR